MLLFFPSSLYVYLSLCSCSDVPLSEKFRREYSTLWRSLFVLDLDTIQATAKAWGVTFDTDMFASAILLRPTRLKTRRNQTKTPDILAREKMTEYELQLEMKAKLKAMLDNEKLIPRELIFLVRAQRMLQSANQVLGSPSNRVNITASVRFFPSCVILDFAWSPNGAS